MKRFVWGIVLTALGVVAIPMVFMNASNWMSVVVFLGVGVPLLIVGYSAQKKQSLVQEQIAKKAAAEEAAANQVKVNCPGCGASVVVKKDTTGKCEYCGSSVNGTIKN